MVLDFLMREREREGRIVRETKFTYKFFERGGIDPTRNATNRGAGRRSSKTGRNEKRKTRVRRTHIIFQPILYRGLSAAYSQITAGLSQRSR